MQRLTVFYFTGKLGKLDTILFHHYVYNCLFNAISESQAHNVILNMFYKSYNID